MITKFKLFENNKYNFKKGDTVYYVNSSSYLNKNEIYIIDSIFIFKNNNFVEVENDIDGKYVTLKKLNGESVIFHDDKKFIANIDNIIPEYVYNSIKYNL